VVDARLSFILRVVHLFFSRFYLFRARRCDGGKNHSSHDCEAAVISVFRVITKTISVCLFFTPDADEYVMISFCIFPRASTVLSKGYSGLKLFSVLYVSFPVALIVQNENQGLFLEASSFSQCLEFPLFTFPLFFPPTMFLCLSISFRAQYSR